MNNNYITKDVHISTIKVGDTVNYEGIMTTVGNKDIKYDSFMGYTLFGDSHKLGNVLIKKIIFV